MISRHDSGTTRKKPGSSLNPGSVISYMENITGDLIGGSAYDLAGNFTLTFETHWRVLPIDMRFNDGHRLVVMVYPLLMVFSAFGNISVFVILVRLHRKRKLSRINLFLLNLTIADLLVTFLMMPLEIGWNATVSWQAGDWVCRIMSFFRIFGLYLSSFMLTCISLDRYFAVLKPLGIAEAKSRGKIMLSAAWIASTVCSLPQAYIFHVERHPEFMWYEQCVTFNSFASPEAELAYNFFGLFFLYVFPLVMIIFCYSRILLEVYRINRQELNDESLRRSNMSTLARAKVKTLKMAVIIVATLFLCWTPYNVMSLWYWFDKESAQAVDPLIQKGLFMFACANSCANPLIYGLFQFCQNKKKSISIPRSLPVGYRYSAQSKNCKTRINLKMNPCCIPAQSITTPRNVPAVNLFQPGTSEIFDSEQTTRREVTISIYQGQNIAAEIRPLDKSLNALRRPSQVPIMEFDGGFSRVTCKLLNGDPKHYIYKNIESGNRVSKSTMV